MNYPKSFIARHIRFINDDVIEVRTARSAIVKFSVLFTFFAFFLTSIFVSYLRHDITASSKENFLAQDLKWIIHPIKEAIALNNRTESRQFYTQYQYKKAVKEFNNGNYALTYPEFKEKRDAEYIEHLKIKSDEKIDYALRSQEIDALVALNLTEEKLAQRWLEYQEREKRMIEMAMMGLPYQPVHMTYEQFKHIERTTAHSKAEREIDAQNRTISAEENRAETIQLWEEYQSNLDTIIHHENVFANDVYNEIFWAWLPVILLFSGILFSSIIPNSRPMRIDRKRRLLYFQGWKKFYIYRYPNIIFPEILADHVPFMGQDSRAELYFHPYQVKYRRHGLYLGLQATDKSKVVVRKLGAFNMRVQGDALLTHFLFNFMTNKEKNAFNEYKNTKNYHPCTRLLYLSVINFYYDENKTERQIQQWLAENSEESFEILTEKEREKYTSKKWKTFIHTLKMEQLEKRKPKPKTKNRKRNK